MDGYGTKLLLAAFPVASTVTSFLTAAADFDPRCLQAGSRHVAA
jgi:hypothetical protein